MLSNIFRDLGCSVLGLAGTVFTMAGLGCSLSRARSAAAAAGGLLVVVISGSTTAEGRGRVGGGGGGGGVGVVRGVEAVKAVWNLSTAAELGVVTGTADCALNRRGRLVAVLAPVRCPNLCWPPNTEMPGPGPVLGAGRVLGPGRGCGLGTTQHESVVTGHEDDGWSDSHRALG